MPNIASAQFKLEAEIRPRAEFRNGFKALRNKNVDPAFFIEQRSRLYFNYTTEQVLVKVTLQDVRIWGSVSQIYKADPNLQNVYEAWGQFNFNDKFGVKAGRMELDYDGARLMGNLGWAAQARSHDALLFLWKNNGLKIDLGLAYNQNWRFEPGWLNNNFYNHSATNNYKTMQFVHLEYNIADGKINAMIHNNGMQVAADSTVAYRQTYAVMGNKKLGDITLNGEVYYQGGKSNNGNSISAYLLALNATFKTKITPITLGAEILSGSNVDDTKDKSFAPLYGTNHKFYGFMDYFYVGNGHQNKGLVDVYVKTNFKLTEKSNLLMHLHNFSSPVVIADPANPAQNISTNLGTELDLVYGLKLHDQVKLNIGYSHMFATPSMVAIKGNSGDNTALNNWAWLMLTFKPTLFESKLAE